MKTDLNLIRSKVVYPSLRQEFNTIDLKSVDSKINNVLFVSSFKRYKGWPIFAEVSNRLIDYKFKMILSHQDDTNPTIKKFNGSLLYNVKDMVPHFNKSDIVCNLSIPSLWKETLGLTIVEAMCFGKIVICPNAGAFNEYIVDGVNGFLLSDVNEFEFENCLKKISNLPNKQIIKIKKNAVNTAKNFEYKTMQLKIKKEIIS
jgi:glycosyltransferase involved in cell wall biosynthesis